VGDLIVGHAGSAGCGDGRLERGLGLDVLEGRVEQGLDLVAMGVGKVAARPDGGRRCHTHGGIDGGRWLFMSFRALPSLAVCLVMALTTSGCILGSSKGAGVVGAVVPDPHKEMACANEGIDGPPGRVCSFMVGGTQQEVVRRLADALTEQGFTVACGPSSLGLPGAVSVAGARPDVRVTADVIPSGFAVLSGGDSIWFALGTQIAGKHDPIQPGWVGVEIDASEYTNAVSVGANRCDDPVLFGG
jgi:hypothetical protein